MPLILVIKHGAMGDFIQATGAFQALRQHHREDRLVLLVSPPFAPLAERTGLFDAVLTDPRAPLTHPHALLRPLRQLASLNPDQVYDLQWSSRVQMYGRILLPLWRYRRWREGAPPPSWCGVLPGCDVPHPDPLWRQRHGLDRLENQLRAAGLPDIPPPSLDWIADDNPAVMAHRQPFVVLVPGASKPAKCWPLPGWIALARHLHQAGYSLVVAGGRAEIPLGAALRNEAPFVHDLTGRTSFVDLAQWMKKAAGVVSNDTGAAHMAGAAGVPLVTLFFTTDPARAAPVSPRATFLDHRYQPPTTLTASTVAAKLLEIPSSGPPRG